MTVLENIKENQDAERLFRQLSTQGHKLCFGTTFSHFASLKKLAPTLKRTHFECCAGIEASDNLGVFEARHYEGTYLTGIAAGRMTKSNILGWVGAFPVPQVIYSLNAFMLGARSVNPNATPARSSGSTPGSIPARRRTASPRWSRRAPTSSPAARTRRCRGSPRRRRACGRSAAPATSRPT